MNQFCPHMKGERREGAMKMQHVGITGYNIISFSRIYQVIIQGMMFPFPCVNIPLPLWDVSLPLCVYHK